MYVGSCFLQKHSLACVEKCSTMEHVFVYLFIMVNLLIVGTKARTLIYNDFFWCIIYIYIYIICIKLIHKQDIIWPLQGLVKLLAS